ncbi:MAG TPA: ComEC/Rec2 family competence protein, partial [Rhodothermales bacterium]|nr:ComEC/Rec2 family competence protein [Rhodothermales bacterium]
MDAPDQHSALVLRACPALLLAACMGCGIAVADRLPDATVSVWFCLAASCLLLLGIASWPWYRARSNRSLLLVSAAGLLAFSLGASAFRLQHTPAPNDVALLLPREERGVTLTGRIENQPASSPYSTRFYLSVRSVGIGPGIRASGRILVVVYPPYGERPRPRPALREGTVVRLRGRLSAVASRRNPADFDYRRYLFLKGITRRLSVSDSADVEILRTDRGWPSGLTDRIRAYVDTRVAAHVPGRRARTLVGALLMGDRSGIDEDVRTDFRRTGLTHLLAVSGLHMMLVGLVLYGLLGPVLTRLGLAWRPREVVRFSVTTLVLAAYAILTGASPSAMRAAVMAVVLLGGNLLQRTSHPLNSLGVAALVLFGLNPADLFDLGFQLSFAAVAGLVLLHPVFMHPFEACGRPVRRAVAALSISLAATLATAPILFYTF